MQAPEAGFVHQVAVKKLSTAGASPAAEAAFLKEVHIAQLASATCQRVCRMLGCCELDSRVCIVMSLYASSAAHYLGSLHGDTLIALLHPLLVAVGKFSLSYCTASSHATCCCAGPVALPELLSMAVEILEGLSQLHAVGVWHLDLKPANILLDEHRHAYLSDFGISYAVQTLQSCTALTSMVGTPHYM